MIKLKILDASTIEILEGISLIREILSYKSTIFVKVRGPKRTWKKPKTIVKNFVNGKHIHTGFLDRIRLYCQKKKIKLEVTGSVERIEADREPELPGIIFRDDQLKTIKKAIEEQRGFIKYPTGGGKSILMFGIMSCFKDKSWLILCYKTAIVNQLCEGLKQFGFNPCKIGAGQKEITSNIVISTLQSWKNMPLVDLADRFDGVLLDEAHLAMSQGGTAEKALSMCLAPLRFGFSGSISKEVEKKMMSEGLLGEVIENMELEEGEKLGILAKAKVKLISVPQKKGVFKTYKIAYDQGIINNEIRNKLIAKVAKEVTDQNESILIFCVSLEHVENLSESLRKEGVKHKVVRGETSQEEREEAKLKLKNKEELCVISTNIWVEGVDIPSLNHVFNATGLYSENALCQKLGRGLRVTNEKKVVTIWDCIDTPRFLARHFAKRMVVYLKNDWL